MMEELICYIYKYFMRTESISLLKVVGLRIRLHEFKIQKMKEKFGCILYFQYDIR